MIYRFLLVDLSLMWAVFEFLIGPRNPENITNNDDAVLSVACMECEQRIC